MVARIDRRLGAGEEKQGAARSHLIDALKSQSRLNALAALADSVAAVAQAMAMLIDALGLKTPV
jgi:hypothetical protein